MSDQKYAERVATTRVDRLRWWQEARFGMLVHWNLATELGCAGWGMNRELIPFDIYDRALDRWHPKDRPAREWVRLAKTAGQKYAVFTAKHHEGLCLWDTRQTDYNTMQRGPGRDFVREFVEACREFDLRVGLYYSLMDWHHPDAERSATDETARRRFVDFTRGCLRELVTQYGKIDMLWYDMDFPLRGADQWETAKTNGMIRDLQPDILIRDPVGLDTDYAHVEQQTSTNSESPAWEATACTAGARGWIYEGTWNWNPVTHSWRTPNEVLGMLCTIAGGQGNLLLNIGPEPDGSVPKQAVQLLTTLGEWLERNGEAVYGHLDRAGGYVNGAWRGPMEWGPRGQWTLQGKTGYFWCYRWPGKELSIAGLKTKVNAVSLLADGAPVAFRQTDKHLSLTGLPKLNPDNIAGVTVVKIDFDAPPSQKIDVYEQPPASYS